MRLPHRLPTPLSLNNKGWEFASPGVRKYPLSYQTFIHGFCYGRPFMQQKINIGMGGLEDLNRGIWTDLKEAG
jgi:hypothetical protein